MFLHRTRVGVVLLRRSVREGSRVRKITLANLSPWTDEQLKRLEWALSIKRRYRGTVWEINADRRILQFLIEFGLPTWRATCALQSSFKPLKSCAAKNGARFNKQTGESDA